MINEKENIKISKFLSLVLRHKPEEIGLELDENGWTNIHSLIEKCNLSNISLTVEILKHIVETNSKNRFVFNGKQDKIRANQGHSIEVELNLKPTEPPTILYHGTASRFISSIMEKGLTKQQRQHVHLSASIETAINVGKRHGEPVVFEISAKQMFCEHHAFFLSNNGVWLIDYVPAKYLKELPGRK